MSTPADESTPSPASASPILSRRYFLEASGAAAALGALGLATRHLPFPIAQGTPSASLTRPNLLILITDQERYPRHWPAGWAAANLPNRERLKTQGLTFHRAFCNASMCSPSRATLLTGLYPAQHGVTRTLTYGGSRSEEETPLQSGMQTLGHMLATAGYRVVVKGKWHVSKNGQGGPATSPGVADFGFHEWVENEAGEDAAPEKYGGGCANWDQQIREWAVDFLAGQTPAVTAAQPFALIVALVNPHDVLAYPRNWDQETEAGCFNYAGYDFNQGIPSLPPSAASDDLSAKPVCQAEARNLYAVGLGTLLTEQQKLDYVNFYAGLQKQTDVHIGAILDAVHPDIWANTLIIQTSDHGEMGLAHSGLRQKMYNAYLETMHIPLIISNPILFPQAQETHAYASLIDLMPTLATLTGVPNPERWFFMGRDLSPILETPTGSVQDETLFTFDDEQAGQADGIPINPGSGQPLVTQPNHIRALRRKDGDGEWLYARYFDPTGVESAEFECYRLSDGTGNPVDPDEVDNIAHPSSPNHNSPFYQAKLEELSARLAALETERLRPLSQLYLPAVQKG